MQQSQQRQLQYELNIPNVFPRVLESSIHRRCAWFLRRICCVANQPAIPHLESPGSEGCVAFRMRYLHDGGAFAIQFTKKFHDFRRLRGMQIVARESLLRKSAVIGARAETEL